MMLKLGRDYRAEASEGMRVGERGSGVGHRGTDLSRASGDEVGKGLPVSRREAELRPGERARRRSSRAGSTEGGPPRRLRVGL